MKVLVTGFEPFGGQPVNPSECVVGALAAQSFEGITLYTSILPVDHARAPAALLEALQAAQPNAVLCLGESGRRMRLSIERVAINLLDYPIADNAGQQFNDLMIATDGPAAYFTTLPVRALLDAVHAANVPVELSLSAGAFLCNQVMYTLLHHIATQQLHIPAGFTHLPFLPEQAARESMPVPSMSLHTMLEGIETMLYVLARDVSISPEAHV